mmetsp:Transcript_32201/g.73981  ORF Transcript_32201/g.73981 Transcript_32201/m.73981 type:complete len:188 (-) Transcript_32201:309-872(-)
MKLPLVQYRLPSRCFKRYAGEDGGTVTESSPTADPDSSPRVTRLVRAEEACLEKGGTCIRLAGLYTMDRGAHNFWLGGEGRDVKGREDGIINLLHYDDAAAGCMAALVAGPSAISGKIFLLSDGNPTTRKDICVSSLKTDRYKDKSIPKFLGGESDPKGKIYDGSHTNAVFHWKPMHESFDAFMSSH